MSNKTTIHTYDQEWEDAEIVGIGDDTLTGENGVLIVRHPHFEHDLDFYQEADEQGKCHNVGNAAFWIAKDL